MQIVLCINWDTTSYSCNTLCSLTQTYIFTVCILDMLSLCLQGLSPHSVCLCTYMDEKPNESWIIPLECQLICHKYAWVNTARWIMFVGTHDAEKQWACVNRLVRKCTPSRIKGIILRQGPSVQVMSWTALETSHDQRCTFVSLIHICLKGDSCGHSCLRGTWADFRFHQQNNWNTLCTLGLNFSLEPDFNLVQNVLYYFADWQLSPPWIYWNVHERWQPRQWIISLVAVVNFQPIRLWRNQPNFNIYFSQQTKLQYFDS